MALFLEISGICQRFLSAVQDAVHTADRLLDVAERRCRKEHQEETFQAQAAPPIQERERREPRDAHHRHHEESAGVGIENGGVARETEAAQPGVVAERSERPRVRFFGVL